MCLLVGIFIKNKPLTITSTFFCLIHVSILSSWPIVYAKSKNLCNTVVSLSTHSILSLPAIFNFFVASDHYPNAISFSQRKYFKIPMEDTRQRPKNLMCRSVMTFSVEKKKKPPLVTIPRFIKKGNNLILRIYSLNNFRIFD